MLTRGIFAIQIFATSTVCHPTFCVTNDRLCLSTPLIKFSPINKIQSYSRGISPKRVCNEWRDPSATFSAWTTQF